MIQGFVEIKGKIKPKQRPKMGRHGVYTPAATHKSEESIALQLKTANRNLQPTAFPVKIRIDLWLPIPKSWSKKKKERALLGYIRPTGKPDIDNTVKTILDAFNGLLYHDDSQVVSCHVEKKYNALGEDDKAHIAWEIMTDCEPRQVRNKKLRFR